MDNKYAINSSGNIVFKNLEEIDKGNEMTIPNEEKWTLLNTRQFLRDVSRMRIKDIKNNARQIREDCVRLLRHYPFDFKIKEIWDKRIEEWGKDLNLKEK